MSLDGYYQCGNIGPSQILRYKLPDLAHSGVTSTYQGGLLTARHVVRDQGMPGFTCHPSNEFDIAFRRDDKMDGLPLGWVDVFGLDVELVTTSLEAPDKVVRVLGRLGITLAPIDLQPFSPYDYHQEEQYIVPGVSGSPLVYEDHIVGVLPARVARTSGDGEFARGQAMAVVFNGEYVKSTMEEFGLQFPDEPLISMS